MSRCFPYPPPSHGQSVIESVKLQKEIERVKKEKEREKNRKKKQKRENETQGIRSSNHEKSHKKRKHKEKSLLVQDQKNSKTSNDVIDQFEKSGLTEDHELPCSIQYKLDSPESSQDSSKRRKIVPSVSTPSTHGTILIKFPSLRQRDPELLLPSLRQESGIPLPSSMQLELVVPSPSMTQRDSHPVFAQTVKKIVNEHPAADEQPCTSGGDAVANLGQEAAVPSHRTSSAKRIGSRTWQKQQFESLVNLNSLVLQVGSVDIADEEWLFGSLKGDSSAYANKCKVNREGLAWGSYVISSQLSRACFVPEFDMYQLPYVVPF